jgi:hypothetical protein
LNRCGGSKSAACLEAQKMINSIRVIAAVALTIAFAAAWSKSSIHADAALQASAPAATDAQVDVLELTKNARSLPAQEFAAP